MLVLESNNHCSEAQVAKALSLINTRLSSKLSKLAIQTHHYVDLKDGVTELSAEELATVKQCLDYGYGACTADGLPWTVTVLPRPGTVTPWSSKASEILALCLHPAPIQRVEHGAVWKFERELSKDELAQIRDILHDKMTQVMIRPETPVTADMLFHQEAPRLLGSVPLNKESLDGINAKLGLALQADEIEYILASWPRDPTDVELMMFAQVNSEHCRHKIFNASWTLDGKEAEHSLFQMIKNTYKCNPEGVLSAYSDNAAVLKGHTSKRFFPDPETKEYGAVEEPIHIVCKVETHNHPTAVSPFPGAATGVGGEIRDEGATGIGGKPKAGLSGFSVSHLLLPGSEQPWEDRTIGKPNRIASALQIMLDAPIGAARFNNEFGRPNVCGYFRSFLQDVGGQVKGYHKPIMLAGGLGNIRDQHLHKKKVGPGCHIVVLGGPAMLIGLGGGAASSMAQGAAADDVDFASVQRDNPELERRCQEVIDRCWELGEKNPILCIHDVGAGGLSNAIPEVLHDSGNGGVIHLRKVPNTEPGMSPMEVWCNEAQERYVIACDTDGLASLEAICKRERCIYGVVGQTTAEQRLIVDDSLFGNTPVDLSMETLFGKPPRMSKSVTTTQPSIADLSMTATADEALLRVLANPTVASKSFLITIGDRTVTGLIARDQMVGKWQVPIADVAVTCSGYEGFTGEAMSCGERTPVAVIDGPSSAGLAIGEAITNILAADVRSLKDIRFSANWMVNSGSNEEDHSLYKTCEKIGMDLAPKLGICIPVGKDSMSMKSIWTDEEGVQKKVAAPLSVVITGFAPVTDVRKTWTPDLKTRGEETVLVLVQLGGENKKRLGGSVLAQVYSTMGNEAPGMGSTDHILAFAAAMTTLRDQGLVLAYHDRSDGGWVVAVAEMCFGGRLGAAVDVKTDASPLAELFNEELGVVLQVSKANESAVRNILTTAGLPDTAVVTLGAVTKEQTLKVTVNGTEVINRSRAELQRVWAEVSYKMQSLRDNPKCAAQEYEAILDNEDPGLHCVLPFSIPKPIAVSPGAPKVAILREQGVNGHVEMANAFHTAGFVVSDVHMSDILSGTVTLSTFQGLACCGGFSFGDTFGAGRGWASTIKDNNVAAAEFGAFFNRSNTFTLGVCNGCQMLGSLSSMVPGASHWPNFTYNESSQYEARVSLVKVQEGATSIFFKGMAGAVLPAAVSHGEGRAQFRSDGDKAACQVPVRYVDNRGQVTQAYPCNPNGSPNGIAGVCSEDGRATIMMPHPERTLRTIANSWSPDETGDASPWGDFSPWIQFFVNARKWCDQVTA